LSESSHSRQQAAKVALGESPADLAVLNATVANVYTAELQPGQTVLVKAGKIAYAGPNGAKGVSSSTLILDASGKTLIPGFIDGHTHMDYIASTPEIVRYALRSGTTSIVSETAQLSSALGYQGVLEYLKSTRRQPVKFWITLPPMQSISPIFRRHAVNQAQIKKLLRRPEVVGLGEVYWAPLLDGDSPQLDFIQATRPESRWKATRRELRATSSRLTPAWV
jgi:adenine deaminase